MSRLNLVGIILVVGAIVLVGFQGLSTLITEQGGVSSVEGGWSSLTIAQIIEKIAGPDVVSSISSIAFLWIGPILNYVITAPLFIVMVALGVFCFILNAIFKE